MNLNSFNFKDKFKKQLLITLTVSFCFFNDAFAAIEKTSTRLTGSQISAGQSMAAVDNKYPNVNMSNTAFINYSVGKIALGIDYTQQNITYNLNTYNFNYNVVLNIAYILADGSSLTKTEKLRLNYSNLSSGIIDKSFAIIKGAHVMSITIDHFETPSGALIASPLIPDNLYLDAEIETERFYELNINTVLDVNHNYIAASNELEVYWNTLTGAEEYELEWTYVNDYLNTSDAYDYDQNTTASIPVNTIFEDLNFTFLNNATKIRTSKNSFKIGLDYNRGLLVYRVRPIGKNTLDINFEAIGKWSTDQSQTQETISITFLGGTGTFNDYYNITTGHEDNKNWQYTATYAEDGKKKEVVSYFDGSFRNRQTVTKTNTEDISIVAETIYDKQGRGAVQILPTPTADYLNILKYFENFNQSETNVIGGVHAPYSKIDIEPTASASCPYSPDPLYTANDAEGASVYYSEFNDKKLDGQNAFIPDAGKYPYTTTIFTPDNTGRVKMQSGVGADHKIGTNHETKYLYGDPNQEDLDKLFGSEAGYVERYKKNTVIDPNGQISVSYLNTENKVVATALAGNSPNNLNSIGTIPLSLNQVSYFNYNDDNYDQINKKGNNAVTFGKKIVPNTDGIYTFEYNLTVPSFTDTCIENFCYDCVYDLEIKITDECGEIKYTNTQKVGLNGSDVDFTCNASPIVYSTNGAVPPFEADLMAGKEYILSKTLSINNDAMLKYLEHYTAMDPITHLPVNNTCIKTIDDFTSLASATVSTSGCEMICDTCVAKVERYYLSHNDNSQANNLSYGYMSPEEKEAAIKECRKPCTNVSLCEVQFGNLLQDVRPNGQYAQYKLDNGAALASDYELSIFNSENKLPLTNQNCDPYVFNGGYDSPFGVSYDIQIASWKNPEYYNETKYKFEEPTNLTGSYTSKHYFNANGSIAKVRLTFDGINYSPAVEHVNSATATYIFTDALGEWTFPENLANLSDFVTNYITNPHWAYSLIKYHPEFNYFLDCIRESKPIQGNTAFNSFNSKQFDDLLMIRDTYAAADAETHFNLLENNTSTDLIDADPYFSNGGPGAGALKTQLQNKLTNYLEKSPGVYMSIKEVAATIHSTGNMHYSTCTGQFGVYPTIPCGTNNIAISIQALDNMWKAYRSMYLSEKLKVITAQSHKNAVNVSNNGNFNSNYYNGAIADPNFNEYVAYQNYGFWPNFPYGSNLGGNPWNFATMYGIKNFPWNYPNCTSLNISNVQYYYPGGFANVGSGFYDFGSPSSFYHKDKYSKKVRRFIDEQTLNNNLAGGASDPATVSANLINYANNEVQLNSGECPLYKRLELFLTTTFNNHSLTDGLDHPLVGESSFTQNLYDKLTECQGLNMDPPAWYPGLSFQTTEDGTTHELTLQFKYNNTIVSGAAITLAPPASIANFDWQNVKLVSAIHFAGNNGTTDFFTLMAYYDDVNPGYETITLNGTTSCIKNNCTPPPALTCKPTQQAIELQTFLNSVALDYQQSPAVSFPIDLSDVSFISTQNFSALVRYPFGNTTVAAGTHFVTIAPAANQIALYGDNTNVGGQVSAKFLFTPFLPNSSYDLSNVIGFTSLAPKQNSTDPYDFTIMAVYGAPGSFVYKKFKVKIDYPPNVECLTAGTPCLAYKIGNCDENISSTCSNDEGYQTGIDFYNFMQDVFQKDISNNVLLNTIPSYSGLLQSQTGVDPADVVSFSFDPNGWVLNPVTNFKTLKFNMYFIDLGTDQTKCTATFTIAAKDNINPQVKFKFFDDFKVVDANTGEFQFNGLDVDTGNDYVISGHISCLAMKSCQPCTLGDTLFIENFDTIDPLITQAQLNFTGSYFATTLNPIPFIGANLCPAAGQGAEMSITSHLYNNCYILTQFAGHDHTKINANRNYLLVAQKGTKMISVYERTITNLTPNKQYEFSAYFRTYIDLPISKVSLIVNNGIQDIEIASFINNSGGEYPLWRKLSGFFTATSNNISIKIKVTNVDPNKELASNKFFMFDDIMLREKQCESPPFFIPPVGEPPVSNCEGQMLNIQTANAQGQLTYYINGIKQDFVKRYTNKCLQSLETMTAEFQSGEGHYTLYYYDQAGNLIKTVPPEGVEILDLTQQLVEGVGPTIGESIKSDRANHTKTVFTNHRMQTKYEYNSLNQLIKQSLPDHEQAEQWDTPSNTNLPANLRTTSMDFSDELNGYMTANDGATGYIYHTQDGGKTWMPVTALGLADMIDFEVNGTKAFVINSDGSLLTSVNYNTSTPTWQLVNLPNSNLMRFNDINFIDANNGFIAGKNGFLMETTDGGINWNQVALLTSHNLTKITHKDDGNGIYIIVTGENGELYYKKSSVSTWTKYFGINPLIDINDCSIISTGNGTSTYLNILVCGKDKSGTIHKANALELKNLDGPSPIVVAIPLSNSNISTTSNSKINTIIGNTYSTPSATREFYLGGVTESVPPKPILIKLTSVTPYTSMTDVNLYNPSLPNTGVTKLALNTPNGTLSSDVTGTLGNGQLIKYEVTPQTATTYNLNTIGSTINSAPLNSIWVDPSNTTNGFTVGDNGTIISFNISSGVATSHAINTVTNYKLYSVAAAKDGTGNVYIVGENGTIIHSSNAGNSWQPVISTLTQNFYTALYMPGTLPKMIFAGSGSYVGEIDVTSSNIVNVNNSGTVVYTTVKKANAPSNEIFIGGGDVGGGGVISKYTLGFASASFQNNVISGLSSSVGEITDIDFAIPNVAYVSTKGGVVLKSVDNGLTYNVQAPSPVVHFNQVIAVDQLTAYVFGDNSTIFKTTDGGINWVLKTGPSGSGTNINAAYDFGNGNIIVSGVGTPGLFNIYDRSNDYSTRFYYDALGRLIISQNSKQFNKTNKAYSYTIYDAIGRIKQVGEISGASLPDPADLTGSNGIIDINSFENWLTLGSKTEVTSTSYDVPVTTSICGFTQENLRKRVSATYLDNDDNLSNGYLFSTLYTYDIHGNVKTLVNENPNLPTGHTCKKIDYTYDLISGKVNKVSYQKGNPDEFYHQYEYDADNRITNVLTSKDGYVWEQDAKYFYYLHGPLARVEIGNEKVQGLDYAYTIQGWIKGINSGNLSETNDIGKDGAAGTLYNNTIADLNKFISKDAASYSLNYFGNDYSAINTAQNAVPVRFYPDASTVAEISNQNNWLYNGNISSMATTIKNPLTPDVSLPQLMSYKYDQLNRLNLATSYAGVTNNVWNLTATDNYKNEFSYDANGNIDVQQRLDQNGALIDKLTYQYHTGFKGKKLSNRLYHVNESVDANDYPDDIDNQGEFIPAPDEGNLLGQINIDNNYSYDPIGNLVKDVAEGIQNIEWNVYGKIAKITRVTGFVKPGATVPPSDLEFLYDASGNRVTKIVKPRTLTGIKPQSDWKYTYYVRDAQGNVMATYEKASTNFDLTEHHLYGSSRLGVQNYVGNNNVEADSKYSTITDTYVQSREAGNRNYELSNHLGNVLSTVSDRKITVASVGNPNQVDHFRADIISASDYYPFGSPMQGRKFVTSVIDYRYGYQSSEKDNEISGVGNVSTTFFRELDTRLGRWWSIDPETKDKKYESPYVSMGNKPIWHNDPLGNTDDKPKKSNPNSPDKKGATAKFHEAKIKTDKENTAKATVSSNDFNKKPDTSQDGVADVQETLLDAASDVLNKKAINDGPYKEIFFVGKKPMHTNQVDPIITTETKITTVVDDATYGYKIVQVPNSAYGVAAKTVKVAGTVVGVLDYGNDVMNYANGDLSGKRFALRSTGFIGGTAVGLTAGGGPLGAAIGLGATAAEMFYDIGKWWGGLTAEWSATTEKALSDGWKPSNPMQIFSDSTLKTSILLATNDSLSDKLKHLNIYSYNYITDAKYGYTNKDIGLLAQDVEKILPNCVHTVNGVKVIDYTRLIPIMIANLNKKDNDIEELKNMVNKLELLILKKMNENNASKK